MRDEGAAGVATKAFDFSNSRVFGGHTLLGGKAAE